MRLFAFLALTIALPAATALVAPPPLGEAPREWACDDAVRVCAGVATGALVDCAMEADGWAWCESSFGWLTRAWSEGGESGSETHRIVLEQEECRTGLGCYVFDVRDDTFSCSWTAVLSCEDSGGTVVPMRMGIPLGMGECTHVSVRISGTIEARVDGLVPALAPDTAAASHAWSAEESGAACRVDDGR